MAADLVFLKDEKLFQLVEIVYRQEVLNIQSIIFQSEAERVAYLNDCRWNYLTATNLLNSAAELKTKFQTDTVRSPLAVKIHAYTESCINNALQIFQNYTVRKDYLETIDEHVKHLMNSLQDLNPENAHDVAKLTMEVDECNKAIITYAAKYRSLASMEFSRLLKAQNITFDNLVQTYILHLFTYMIHIYKYNNAYIIYYMCKMFQCIFQQVIQSCVYIYAIGTR